MTVIRYDDEGTGGLLTNWMIRLQVNQVNWQLRHGHPSCRPVGLGGLQFSTVVLNNHDHPRLSAPPPSAPPSLFNAALVIRTTVINITLPFTPPSIIQYCRPRRPYRCGLYCHTRRSTRFPRRLIAAVNTTSLYIQLAVLTIYTATTNTAAIAPTLFSVVALAVCTAAVSIVAIITVVLAIQCRRRRY